MTPSPDPRDRPRASVVGSIIQGWSRVLHAPWLAGGLLVAALMVPMPLTDAVSGPLTPLSRFVLDEMLGLGRTVTSAIHLLEEGPATPGLVSHLAVYVVLWLFLAGGIVDRLARGRTVGSAHFFAVSGGYFARFVRLAVIVCPIYWGLLFAYRLLPGGPGIDAAFLVAIVVVNLIVQFAVVRAVVEDRHSVLGALAASARFIRRRPARVLTLYLLNIAVPVALTQVWLRVTTASVPTGLTVAYVLILVDLWARLAAVASQTVFFQNELAHAHYTAAPPPTWPDSAAVEAIENLTRIAQASGSRRDTDGAP
jgi:hypothetical protein